MSVELARQLRRLAADGSTGVLHAGDGAFHLTDGTIACADCRRTTGLDRLVLEAGVATPEEWQRAGTGDLGPLLHRAALESLALLSVYDAAYFLLAAPAAGEFRPAPPHWLAPVCRIDPDDVVQECTRRGDPEAGPWPAMLVDRAPVVPARRISRRRVVLTGGQAEMLAAADSRRTVSTIAHDLGRTAFGCLTDVRELTEAGLIEPAVPVAPARLTVAPEPAAPIAPPRHLLPVPLLPVAPERQPVSQERPSEVSERPVATPLPRRRVRSAATTPVSDRWKPIDREVLVRVRAALEELA